MTQQGNHDHSLYADIPFQGPHRQSGPLFSGKPYLPNPYPAVGSSNLAVKNSIGKIFDEFTEFISGELKSMNLEEFEQKDE
jgi:hypothetical protein